jgi:hypothetical protein
MRIASGACRCLPAGRQRIHGNSGRLRPDPCRNRRNGLTRGRPDLSTGGRLFPMWEMPDSECGRPRTQPAALLLTQLALPMIGEIVQ